MKSCSHLKDRDISRVVNGGGVASAGRDANNLNIRSRIFARVAQRTSELGLESSGRAGFCPDLNPDVILLPDDQSLLFEVQNVWALELVASICGFASETMMVSERIRVHHCRSRQIVEQLKAAGAIVAGEI